MMDEKRVLTLKGFSGLHILLISSAIGMLLTSLYLWAHYLQTFYSPTGMGNLCDIHGFFSCDAIAYSKLSAPVGIPISVYGALAGIYLLFSSIFPSHALEGTNNILSRINFAGCLFLCIYSLLFINHVCPACTMYYIFSGLAFFAFFKGSQLKQLSTKVLIIYGIIAVLTMVSVRIWLDSKKEELDRQITPVVQEFFNLPDLGTPVPEVSFRIHSATKEFTAAPLQITIFSDFQCPACDRLVPVMHKLIDRYKNDLNIQFVFYPLDNECHPELDRAMHPLACKASYLAACLPDEFAQIHDYIFAQRTRLNESWLQELAREHGVLECMQSSKTRDLVTRLIIYSSNFNIKATPTLVINGRKMEGVRPPSHLAAILDKILETVGKK